MSLPNDDDDDNGRPPWRDPVGRDALFPAKKISVGSSNGDDNADDRTADETSIGSMSFRSDIATPLRSRPTRSGSHESPMSALTTNTMNIDDSSLQSGATFNTQDAASIQLRRGRNRRRLQRLGVATLASFVLFVYLLFPTVALFSMILFGSVASAFLYQLTEVARWEFQRSILEGRGIGDYLPESLYEQMTSTSVHDYLSDPNGLLATLEHLPYLLLYMLPGLTTEQLDQYISRLSPNHQRLLRNEQGLLGFLVNMYNHRIEDETERNRDSTLMRFIMGDERLRDWRQQGTSQHLPSNIAPRRLELPPTIPEGSEENSPAPVPAPERMPQEAAPLTRESESRDPVPVPPSPGIPATVAAIVDRAAVPNPPPATDSSTQPTSPMWTSEESVLLDAVGTAVANIASDTTTMAQTLAMETVRDTVAVPMYRVSLGVTAIGLGLGVYGLSNGAYDLRSLSDSIGRLVSSTVGGLLGGSSGGRLPRDGMPHGGFLLGSTIASGTTALVLGLRLGIFGTDLDTDASTKTGNNEPHRGDPPPKPETG